LLLLSWTMVWNGMHPCSIPMEPWPSSLNPERSPSSLFLAGDFWCSVELPAV